MLENINIIGCGYIGKKIAHALSVINVEPDCFVSSEKSKNICNLTGLKVTQINLDKMNAGSCEQIFYGLKNSVIAYLVPPQREGDIDLRMESFILSLKALDESPVKIILISTTGVYGDCKGKWIDEQQAVNPQVDRARRRLSAENQLKKYCDHAQVEYIVFRVPGIYAADKLPVKRITSGEPIVNAKDSGFTNRIHADDLVAFCVEALVSDVPTGIYNCCDGHPSTMNDYFHKVAKVLKVQPPEEISLQQAQQTLSTGMLSYLAESKRIDNKKLLSNFKTEMKYPDLAAGLQSFEFVK